MLILSMEDTRVVDLYERHAEAWVQDRLREATLYEKDWLESFCALIPPRSSVLDCGCGAGEPIARFFSEQGYVVTGIDSSAAMVRMFKSRLPYQRALVRDMRSLTLGDEFNGILAWDSFFHLSPLDQTQMFRTFRNHSAPRAALMFTSGTSHGEALGTLKGEPLYHASLDAAEYRQLLEHHGFSVVSMVTEDPNCGGRTVWLAQLR